MDNKKSNKLVVFILIAAAAILLFVVLKPKVEAPVVVTPEEPAVVSGMKEDLISFSLLPGDRVSGMMNVTGTLQDAYFFEANIRVDILDEDMNTVKEGFGTATTDWMTTGPVSFQAMIDFTGLSSGPAFIAIRNDNPSGLSENDKEILVPVVIE